MRVSWSSFTTTVSTCALALAPIVSYANPTGGNVVAGDLNIQHEDSTTTINQISHRAIIDWTDFSIAEGETTIFNHPNTESVTLNRVTGGQVSQILGDMQANGRVFLINPNGVIFGQNAQVDVGSLVATTSNINNDDFISANYAFDQQAPSNAQIINAGTLTAKEGGLVALVAPIVKNSGLITAKLGKVTLAGGKKFTLDLYGDQLLALAVDDTSLNNTLAENNGTIETAGGYIVLTAGQAQQALNNVVNNNGTLMADTLDTSHGRIVLGSSRGLTTVEGTATTNSESGTAGDIQALGTHVAIRSGATLQANGATGGGNINIGGSQHGTGPLPNATRTLIEDDLTIEANATDDGSGGNVVVWADELTGFAGSIEATGGENGGNGGTIEISGQDGLIFNGTVDTSAAKGTNGNLLFDPADIVIHDGFGQVDDTEISDATILETDSPGSTFNISEVTLETLGASNNVTLEATNDITVNDLSNDALDFTSTLAIILKADSDNDGTGDFTMLDTNDSISTQGGTLSISGANITVGGLDTSAGSNGHITLAGSTGTTLYGDINTEGGNLTITGPVTLATNLMYDTGTTAADATFNNPITGDYNLILDLGTTGDATFTGVDINALSLVTGNNLTIGGTIETDATLNFSNMAGLLTLTANSALYARDGAATSNIVLPNSMSTNGAYNLDIIGADLTLQDIGNTTPLGTLTAVGSLINLGGAVTTTGAQTYTGDVTLYDNLTTTNNAITLTGDLTLEQNVLLSTNTAGGSIGITGDIDGGYGLTLNAGTGDVTLGGAVGSNTPLSQLTATGTNLTLAQGVITSGQQAYTGDASIGGTFQSTGNNITFTNTTTLAANTTVNTGTAGGDISFGDTIDGAYTLTANAGTGAATLGADVGGSVPLSALTVDASTINTSNITTTNNQALTGNLTLGGDLQSNAGSLIMTGDVTLQGDTTLTNGGGVSDQLTVTGNIAGDYLLDIVAGGGDITIGSADVDTLTFTSGDDLTIGTAITTDTAQDYTNIDTITTTGDTVFTAYDGTTYSDITFDAANIITASGNVTLLGDTLTLYDIQNAQNLTLTGNTAIGLNSDLTTTGSMIFNGGPVSLGGTLTTTNSDITLNSPLTLTADSTLNTGAGAGNITLGSTTNGAYNLTLTAGTGNMTATGDIGGLTPLNILNVTAQNIAVSNVTTNSAQNYIGTMVSNGLLSGGNAVNITGDTTLGGGAATNSGSVLINGNVILTADSILRSGGTLADNITINGNIDGDYNLTLDAGLADISISGDVDINALDFTNGDTLTLGSGSLITDNGMNFSNLGQIQLSADTSFIASDGTTLSDITMGSSNVITGPYALAFTGDNILLYTIGEANNIANSPLTLTVDANNFYLYGAVYTQNEQTYTSIDGLANDIISNGSDITFNTNLELQGDVTISTGNSSSGNIIFGGPVDGNYNLTIDSGTGNITAATNFGDTVPLASLTVRGSEFSLYDVTTTGQQDYYSPIQLHGDLTTTGNDITFYNPVTLATAANITTDEDLGGHLTFNNTVNGAYDLTLTAGTGDITFNDALGLTDRLGILTITNVKDMVMNNGAQVTKFVQTGATGDTLILGDSPGLDSLQGIEISRPGYITGRLSSSRIKLESAGGMDIEVYTDDLMIGGESSRISGEIKGRSGFDAARQVTFSRLTGGPHTMNGYALPLTDDITALVTHNTTQLSGMDTPLPLANTMTLQTVRALNPFSADVTLIAEDTTGLLSPSYLTGDLWNTSEDDIPLSLLETN